MRKTRRQAGILSADHIILDLFRNSPDGYVSGEEMSRILGVSRTAVWKHINGLKELGYRIDAVPSRGYRLTARPDLLTAAELEVGNKRVGRKIIALAETDSTNTVAFRIAEEGEEEGTVVLAETQSRGRGRLGRQWESPAGVNLYCSIILRPPMEPLKATQLTFLSAVAVAKAVEATTKLRPEIKWPNDILIGAKKVAGLLNELSAETERINFVILGIGVNINMRQKQFPATLRHPATSLFIEQRRKVDRGSFARALFAALDELYDLYLHIGYEAIRQEWLSRCTIIGRNVSVSLQENVIKGKAIGIDEMGALLVETRPGQVERILAGDVSLQI